MSAPVRTILAFVIAPIMPALALTFLALLAGGPFAGLGLGLYALQLNAKVGYPVALLGGAPLHLLFHRLGWVGKLRYLGAGIALGAATGAFGSTDMFQIGDESAVRPFGETMVFIAAGAACGALAAASFWLIARPDRGASDPKRAL